MRSSSRSTIRVMRKSRTADSIVISKWIGLKGSSLIAREKEAELLKYFPASFIETARDFDKLLSVDTEKKILKDYDVSACCETGEGGIYGALWDLAEAAGTGIDVYLRDIPVKQETIEIANYFDIDPYLLYSEGAMVVITGRGYELARTLRNEGINAEIAGSVTDSNDRVILNGEIRRFLSPRYKDELFRVINKERSFIGNNG